MIKKNILLPNNQTLEVECTNQFLSIVCSHFGLLSINDVKDDHIRLYVYGAFKNAIEKEVDKC